MSSKAYFKLFIVIGFLPFFWYVLIPWLNRQSEKDRACTSYRDAYIESFSGRVKKKFYTVNHGGRRGTEWNIVYTTGPGNTELIRDFPEFTGFYAFVNPGDSIIKKPNTTFCTVRSVFLHRDSIFGYKNACADSMKWRK